MSRQKTISYFHEMAGEGRKPDIIFLANGGWSVKPINSEIILPFLPKLKLVCGLGAGFDHGAYISYGRGNSSLSEPGQYT
jgi:hypothetical protein